MSNSVVKVTDSDSTIDDNLLLLIGEDGTVTPSKDVVKAYLSGKSGATNLQVMHINKSDNEGIDVAVDDMLYVPDAEADDNKETSFDDIAYNLYNIKLDHDYTPHCGYSEDDELARTLSILDGDEDNDSPSVTKPLESRSLRSNAHESPKPKTKVATPLKTITKDQAKKIKTRTKSETSIKDGESPSDAKKVLRPEHKPKDNVVKSLKTIKPVEPESPKAEKPQPVDPKSAEKKQPKKDRKVAKPVPDDFALFSTPDIIRRVGGKEPISPELSSPDQNKPAKIETRSKSVSDSAQVSPKQNRLSLDGKVVDKSPSKKPTSDNKAKKIMFDNTKTVAELEPKPCESNTNVEPAIPEPMIANNEDKSFPALPLETPDLSGGENNMALDGNGLDLDPSLLENINNDLISEDILYQVAQSLVSNTELQNAIDKSLNEENLGLDSSVQEVQQDDVVHNNQTEQVTSSVPQKGTQIVRPDGRIVVIPPIERPTTRSRNKNKDADKPTPKFVHKPLDEEHVSGNELDSSEEEEEESEDDPNKLWCICNQPHNNRFMICCDTCEEWYHGKCVNITKAMGQQMEAEGREWICLFCKDPLLKRPQAAARRIRKASRNSRQSTDSSGSTKVPETRPSSVPCVVCQKPSRTNSIFCSESCILAHAQGVERVVVFERSTGNMLTGNKAPSAANLEQWLKEHPGYEVVRSAGKIVTTKQTQKSPPSKIKILKGSETPAMHFQNRMKNLNKTVPKSPQVVKVGNTSGLKVLNRQISTAQLREKVSNSLKEAASPTKFKIVTTSTKSSSSPANREKPTTPKVQKVRNASTPQAKQENIRDNVKKTVYEQLTNRLKMVDDLKLSEEELKNISLEIESQLYKCFGDTGQKYRNKYRSLIFNIKDIKNQTLWRRICEKTINPYQLVRLSPDDLASQELALWRERETKHQLDMIKKSELELLQCNRQYVLKTHKGEQILEDNRPTDNLDNTEVITSLTDNATGEKTDRKDDRKKHSHRDKERKSTKDKSEKSHHSHRSTSRDHDRSRKRSRSRDRSSKHVEKRRSRSRDRHRRSSHKSSRHKKESHRGSSTEKLDKKSKEILEQLVDNKIVPPLEDRLWKHVPQEDVLPNSVAESDSDHEPTSTVTIPTPPRNNNDSDEFAAGHGLSENKNNDKYPVKEQTEVDHSMSPVVKPKVEEIWRGTINMVDVAQISITAHEVSGDCSGLATELPANLDIVGRISPDTVWDYIGKMKCSNSKIISVVRLNAINVEEKMPYLALYSYLSSRNRLGVVKSVNKAVKDFYILPLASQKPIPQALLPLNGPGFEEARPALLLGILVRDKRKRPYVDSASSAPSVKKTKTEMPSRSYTPPPVKDSRLKLPLPPPIGTDQDGDEPYSPEDSDPDSIIPATTRSVSNSSTIFLDADAAATQAFQPFVNKFEEIPGLDNATLPSSTQEIQRQMEKLNKEIEMQKSEINSISQNIATASNEIGTSALANIALPSNLQQILDSIKTIGSTSALESLETKPQAVDALQESSDFTIPLMLPTTFSRHSASSENTIPLNLPSKKKVASEAEKTSVLSSLSEEDLIRKAEEMLEASETTDKLAIPPSVSSSSQILPKVEMKQPPIPGLEDDV